MTHTSWYPNLHWVRVELTNYFCPGLHSIALFNGLCCHIQNYININILQVLNIIYALDNFAKVPSYFLKKFNIYYSYALQEFYTLKIFSKNLKSNFPPQKILFLSQLVLVNHADNRLWTGIYIGKTCFRIRWKHSNGPGTEFVCSPYHFLFLIL